MKQPRNTRQKTGVDEFFDVLKSYNKILVWTFGAAVAPLAAGMAKLAPPWPPAIIQITAIFEVLILLIAFQSLKKAKSKSVTRILIVSLICVSIFLLTYIVLISTFVYEEPISGKSFVKGFSCTPEAIQVFNNRCPFFTDDDLRTAEWEAGRFWLQWSITAVRVSIVVCWISMFGSIATSIGSFLVYQGGVRARNIA